MRLSTLSGRKPRRGAVVVLLALMLVFLVGMVAFAVDIGWIALVKNHLQVAVDAAAHAGAAELGNGQTTARTKAIAIAGQNIAGGQTDYVTLQAGDVTFGSWDGTTKTFIPGGNPSNGVKVTATKDLPLYFAPVLGISSQRITAQAIATVSPRDIGFVIDLSGSMNNDTEIWATASINSAFTGYPTIGSDLMQNVFNDFGFGSYPGVTKHVGEAPGQGTGLSPVGYVPSSQLNDNAYLALAKGISGVNLGTGSGVAFLQRPSGETPTLSSTYKILSGDNDATRKDKAYKFIIDYQLKQLMPNAIPAVNSGTNFAYWSDYLDYILKPKSSQPVNQDSYQLSGAGNPYTDAWPGLGSSAYSGFYNKLGYQTYVQFMMDYGRNKQAGGRYVALSASAPDCPWKPDTDPNSAGYGMSFPPREQPTHAGRVAIIAAIKEIEAQNIGINGTLNDHVAVISFDTAAGTVVKYPLQATTMDYTACRMACRDLQAVADDQLSTATEIGFIQAINHLDDTKNPNARAHAKKVIVAMTDGIPNIRQSSTGTIDAFVSSHGSVEWFSSGSNEYERNAALMQNWNVQNKNWRGYLVGLGLGCDRQFTDRGARTMGTAITDPSNPNGPKISPYADGNPANYQERLITIFKEIISSKTVALVN